MKNVVAIATFIIFGLITSFYVGFGIGKENTDQYPVDEELKGLNEQVTLTFSYVVAENTPKGQAARFFAQKVEEKTEGWVDIQLYPNGMLFEAQEEFVALNNEKVDIIAPAFSEIAVLDPAWMVMDLPYAFDDEDMVKAAFEGKIGKLLFESIEEKENFKGLAFWDNGFKQFTNNIHPIREPEDVEGMTFRVMPSDVLSATYDVLNAYPIQAPFNDVYSLLNHGQIDGTENTLSNIYSKGFYEKQEYMTLSNHNYLGYAVFMNRSMWNQLPVEHQQAINEAMEETTNWLRQHAKELNHEMLGRIEMKSDITIYELSQEEREKWREHLRPIYEQYEEKIGTDIMEELYHLQQQ